VPSRPSLPAHVAVDVFADRHIGTDAADRVVLLSAVGASSIDALIDRVVPSSIRMSGPLELAPARSEVEVLERLREIASHNEVLTSLIGMGYTGTVTPPVIARNVLENPAWYTAYTPYQPEISQGRLEALLNFQTMVADLTGMDLANASMLDEGTAAAEAMTMARRISKHKGGVLFVDADTHPQTIAVIETRAEPLGIEVVVGDLASIDPSACFAVLVSYPGSLGAVRPIGPVTDTVHAHGGIVIVAADLLALVLLDAPGRAGADIVVGTSQRFGVPMGFGGPHAAFLATREQHARSLPGRLVGVSTDAAGRPAIRLALQTREQHIRREKATSNICTAQALLAIMAGMYAVWHGPDGLRRIAERVHALTSVTADALLASGFGLRNDTWFDTLTVLVPGRAGQVLAAARAEGINLRLVDDDAVALTLDETSTLALVRTLCTVFGAQQPTDAALAAPSSGLPTGVHRTGELLTHPVFNRYHSEHEMLRYLRRLADRDLALDRTMIPLGSCTMKLNATTEMAAITWPAFADIHPFAPVDQVGGYLSLIHELEQMLVACTGYDAVSLQPNAGSQGELAGLLAIRAYHRSRGDEQRTVCLIPSSAHGTNAASAVMAGLQVVVVACDERGNVDLADLANKVTSAGDRLAACMVTYPSTHGVFEQAITELCALVHDGGGQVYVDGANLNALVGLAQPGRFGADVSHLNLHKTFCIPHGGGGPGVGPVAVRGHLAPFLPAHPLHARDRSVGPVSAAPFGSAGILPISWAYVALMGPDGLRDATASAILNANYVARRLDAHFPVLYTGEHGDVAHECIVDLRPMTKATGLTVDDVAKRLIDYGFHAPTMSFPVAGTLMIEPTESEGRRELDRFCDAMISIRGEVDRVASGEWPVDDNPMRNAPHTAEDLLVEDWKHPYPRELAAFPLESLRVSKYFAPVSRIDAAQGDRNLVCSCLPIEEYALG
jgi:glycine dehydrogenase